MSYSILRIVCAIIVVFGLSSFVLADSGHTQENYDSICDAYALLLDGRDKEFHLGMEALPDSELKQFWKSLAQLPPEERYEVFKASAQHYVDSEWTCGAMKKVFSAS